MKGRFRHHKNELVSTMVERKLSTQLVKHVAAISFIAVIISLMLTISSIGLAAAIAIAWSI